MSDDKKRKSKTDIEKASSSKKKTKETKEQGGSQSPSTSPSTSNSTKNGVARAGSKASTKGKGDTEKPKEKDSKPPTASSKEKTSNSPKLPPKNASNDTKKRDGLPKGTGLSLNLNLNLNLNQDPSKPKSVNPQQTPNSATSTPGNSNGNATPISPLQLHNKIGVIALPLPKREQFEEKAQDAIPPDNSALVVPMQKIANERVKGISKRIVSGYAETIGRRPTMEDRLVIFGNFKAPESSGSGTKGKGDADYFAVFDGHNGDQCANYCSVHLHDLIMSKMDSPAGPSQYLKSSFQECHQGIEKEEKLGGTTAVVALFLQKELWIANTGDSRAVICKNGKAHRVTTDHKPHLPVERERIVRCGGFVMNGKVTGTLTVSRAVGDVSYKPYLTAEPDVFGPFDFVEDNYQLLVIACDGLWDVVDDEEAVEIALECPDPHDAAVRLRETARQRLSKDNISVLVVFFPKFKPPPVGSLSVNIVEGEKNSTHSSNNSTPANSNNNNNKPPEKSNSVSISNNSGKNSNKSTPTPTQAKSRGPASTQAQSRGVPNLSIPKLGTSASKVPPIMNLAVVKNVDSDDDEDSSEENSSGEDSE